MGFTEAEVRKSGRPAMMAKMAMEDVGRAFEKGETQGFMKVLATPRPSSSLVHRSSASAATR